MGDLHKSTLYSVFLFFLFLLWFGYILNQSTGGWFLENIFNYWSR